MSLHTLHLTHTLPTQFLSQAFFLPTNRSCPPGLLSLTSGVHFCTGLATSRDFLPFCILAKAQHQGRICFLPAPYKQKLPMICLYASVPCTWEVLDKRLCKGKKCLEPGTHVHARTTHTQNPFCSVSIIPCTSAKLTLPPKKHHAHLPNICHAQHSSSSFPSHPLSCEEQAGH